MNTRAAIATAFKWMGLALVATVALPCAMASGPRLRIEVPAPFQIGTRSFPAGVVQVHCVRELTPTTALLEVWVDGECLGMVRAHIASTEEAPRSNEAIFHRCADGRLTMIGYSVVSGAHARTYRFELPFAPGIGVPVAFAGGAAATTSVAASFGTR